MNIQALFEQPLALPSPPNLVKALVFSFEDEDVSVDEIVEKIKVDQVISAKLLRLANSAYYHASKTINTVDQAVIYLGFNTTRTLVISSGLIDAYKTKHGFALEYFWRYSLHTAVVAKWLAKKVGQNPEVAFTIGLMHAIGELILHISWPEKCAEMDQVMDLWHEDRVQLELSSLGYHFANVSAELARRWEFPPLFSETLSHFADPLTAHPSQQLTATIVAAAWFSRAQKNALTVEQMEVAYPNALQQLLNVSFDDINQSMPSLDELSNGLDMLIM